MKTFPALLLMLVALCASMRTADADDWGTFTVGVNLADVNASAKATNKGHTFKLEPSGPMTGLHAAYDRLLFDNIDVGVMASANFFPSISDTQTDSICGKHGCTAAQANVVMETTGDLRGRLGYRFGDFLPYLTGGWGIANGTAQLPNGTNGAPQKGTVVANGPVLGLGLEYFLTDHLSVGGEFLHSRMTAGKNDAIILESDQAELRFSYRW